MRAGTMLTPDLMYRAAAVVALLDAGFAAVLWWRVGADGLRRARWPIAVASGVFWFGVWTTKHTLF
jgi:hypothetical protein